MVGRWVVDQRRVVDKKRVVDQRRVVDQSRVVDEKRVIDQRWVVDGRWVVDWRQVINRLFLELKFLCSEVSTRKPEVTSSETPWVRRTPRLSWLDRWIRSTRRTWLALRRRWIRSILTLVDIGQTIKTRL